MKTTQRLALIALLFFSIGASGQNEATKWYFGGYAALDFMTTPPTALTTNVTHSWYCSASMADAAGNLLFYTDGKDVYTSTHTLMANGSGIATYTAASQPCMIVPRPGSSSQYYIFSVEPFWTSLNNGSLSYAVVDMSLANGQGSVTAKQVTVFTGSVSGKLTGTKHCNGTDYWVVIKEYGWNNNIGDFHAFQVSAAGVNTVPVTSTVITTYTNVNNNYWGCMKISPNGKKLALANYNGSWLQNTFAFELWDFDNATGAVTNSLGLATWSTGTQWWGGWGVEFSPDNTKLYGSRLNNGSNTDHLLQWDLCAGSPSAIAASQASVSSSSTIGWGHGSMQLAPDGKIYIANYWGVTTNSQAISVINFPNNSAATCSYSNLGQSISPGYSSYGLPNFMGSYFVQAPPVAPFTHTVSNGFGCQAVAFTSPVTPNTTITACASMGYSLQSLLWDFGDPASGSANTSTLANPIHAYTSLGTYTAKLILYYSCGGGIDTISQVINVNQPCISVSSTSITCASLGSATVVPTGGIGPFSYTWMPSNQTGSVATGLSPGSYTITVFDFGNNFTYTAQTIFTSLIPLMGNINHASSVTCHGASTATANVTNLSGGSGSETYWWSDGTTTYTNNAVSLSAGLWSVVVTDALTGCTLNDLFLVTEPPVMNLVMTASSPSVCAGQPVTVSGVNSGGTPGVLIPYTYTWTNGLQNNSLTVTQNVAGVYTYTLQSRDSLNCLITNTVAVNVVQNPVLNLASISICPLEVGTLTVTGASTYTWSDNTTGPTFTASPASSTQYSVIGSAAGCTSAATAWVMIKQLPIAMFSSNSPRCNGENLQLFATGGQSYQWEGPLGFTSNVQYPVLNSVDPNVSGVYQVTVTGVNSCTTTASGTVVVHPTPTLAVSASTVCETHSLNLFASSDPGNTFSWKGPGGFSSNAEDPVISPVQTSLTGNYSVTVYGPNSCSNTAVVHASVAALPTPSFVANSPLCVARDLKFNSNGTIGAEQFQWSGPGGFSSTIPNPTLTNVAMQNAGVYTLVVTAGPCVTSIQKNVVVNPLPAPQITGPDKVCQGKPLQLTVTASGHQLVSYLWLYPQGGSGQQTISFDSTKFHHSGVYSATVTDNNQCSGSVTSQIEILANPDLTVTGDTVCLNNSATLTVSGAATYEWSGPNLLVATGPQAVVAMAPDLAPTSYMVIGTAVNGCTAVGTAEVHTKELPVPVMKISPRNIVCISSDIKLEGEGGEEYEWRLPNSFIYRGKQVQLKVDRTDMAGQYTLVVTDRIGCQNYTVSSVEVHPYPNGSLTSTYWDGCVPFCADFKFQPSFTSTNVVSVWRYGQKSAGGSFSNCFNTPGTYVFSGRLEDTLTGCVQTQTYQVVAYRKPIADFVVPKEPVEVFHPVSLTAIPAGTAVNHWSWHLDNGNILHGETVDYSFQDPGKYRIALVISDEMHCSDTVVKTIEVREDFDLYVPNAFTPNADELNQTFRPVGRGITKYEMQIFNRGGERVFLSRNIEHGWDGTYMGEPCKGDSYVWTINITNVNGEFKQYSGYVILIR